MRAAVCESLAVADAVASAESDAAEEADAEGVPACDGDGSAVTDADADAAADCVGSGVVEGKAEAVGDWVAAAVALAVGDRQTASWVALQDVTRAPAQMEHGRHALAPTAGEKEPSAQTVHSVALPEL